MLLDNKKIKTWHIYLLIVIVQISAYYFTREFIMTKEFYKQLLGDRLTIDMINTQMEISNRFAIWGYFLIPLVALIQITFFALLIQFHLLLKLIDIPFKKLFRISAFSILPFVILQIIKTYHMYSLPLEQISQKAMAFTPLSINSLINPEVYSQSTYQFLGNFHIFWLIWIFIIYRGLTKTEKIEKIDGLLYPLGVFLVIILFQYGLSTYLTKVMG